MFLIHITQSIVFLTKFSGATRTVYQDKAAIHNDGEWCSVFLSAEGGGAPDIFSWFRTLEPLRKKTESKKIPNTRKFRQHLVIYDSFWETPKNLNTLPEKKRNCGLRSETPVGKRSGWHTRCDSATYNPISSPRRSWSRSEHWCWHRKHPWTELYKQCNNIP